MQSYNIGQVSKIVGLPTKTIRFYEESGVISKIFRKENGYRSYSQSTIEELKILKHARDLGLPLSEIKKLIKGCEEGNCKHTKKYIRTSISNYESLLDSKIAKLNKFKKKLQVLKKSLNFNHKNYGQNIYCCNILGQLTDFTKEEGGDENESVLLKP
ncbi:MerR family transcriptional regulator [Candidatus Parcubacteria bacterium]|nr:MAG: MerR family transcriptional regulator [Candidatus Parcubacteria bacterium]